MMISAKLVTCNLCQNYYSDPRQIPCSHSFCFDCISGRFNEETFLLICPKCDKSHQYQSIEEFHQRCMRDGFLSSMVAQFKKNQSRLTSRPSSTVSHLSSPIPPSGIQENNSNQFNSDPQQEQQQTKSVLIAKCQSCNIRSELIVCQHCDNVICSQCIQEHSNVLSKDVKNEWQICKTKFEELSQRSIRFDQDQEEIHKRSKQLQTFVIKHSEQLQQTIEGQKLKFIELMDNHRQTYKQSFAQEQVIDEYGSIDERLRKLLESTDVNTDKINDFLFEIEHLEKRLDSINEQFDTNQIKFPCLTLPEKIPMSTLFGKLEYTNLHSTQTNADSDMETKLDDNDDDYILIDSISSNEQKKKLLWQIDYFSVPYYVRTFNNQLFVCDKYGSLAIYKLNGQSKPSLIREIKLFKDPLPISTTNDEDQTIIDSFTIYKFWIIVFKRKKNELHGAIYLFTHEGKLISNGKFPHTYPSRELTVDGECDRLWSLDQKQLCLFYYNLPETKPVNAEEYFQNRHPHVQFSKPFAPIHISANKTSLAVLDKNRQAIHVYEKKTRQQLYEYVNTSYTTTHFCWDMALFSDNNLLIKLDESSTLKSGPSKHIYLQLDAKRQYSIIGSIEEIDAYGMMITANDEILIGVRINTKGIIKCYV